MGKWFCMPMPDRGEELWFRLLLMAILGGIVGALIVRYLF
jgi:hypothetical protein